MSEIKFSRLFVFRTEQKTGKIYSAFSEDKNYLLDVEFTLLGSLLKSRWRLDFKTGSDLTTTEMSQDNLNFTFFSSDGKIQGSVEEAVFSVMGKSVVKDENQNILGFVRSRMAKTIFLSSDSKEIGNASWHREPNLPLLLRPSKAHLIQRYLVETNPGHLLDYRLIYCFIGMLVATEWGTSSAG